ncbi:MAG: hypothetical protein IIZ61_05130 [Lachnospiraceae bacterium]|nr:hypothetical protein [Lachnospiraceae bacterium]
MVNVRIDFVVQEGDKKNDFVMIMQQENTDAVEKWFVENVEKKLKFKQKVIEKTFTVLFGDLLYDNFFNAGKNYMKL